MCTFKEDESKESNGEVPVDNYQSGIEYSSTTDVNTGALEEHPSTTLKFTTEDIFTNNFKTKW